MLWLYLSLIDDLAFLKSTALIQSHSLVVKKSHQAFLSKFFYNKLKKLLTSLKTPYIILIFTNHWLAKRLKRNAGIAQLVERNLAKVEVASSRLVSRSRFQKAQIFRFELFLLPKIRDPEASGKFANHIPWILISKTFCLSQMSDKGACYSFWMFFDSQITTLPVADSFHQAGCKSATAWCSTFLTLAKLYKLKINYR